MFATVIVPVFISLIGRKRSLCFGGILQAIYLFTYVNPVPELYYIFSAIAGVGSSFIWITMGTEIGVNSTNETAHRFFQFFKDSHNMNKLFIRKQSLLKSFFIFLEILASTGLSLCLEIYSEIFSYFSHGPDMIMLMRLYKLVFSVS